VFDLNTHDIFVTRDVVFHEEVFPFANKSKVAEPTGGHNDVLEVGKILDDLKELNNPKHEVGLKNAVVWSADRGSTVQQGAEQLGRSSEES